MSHRTAFSLRLFCLLAGLWLFSGSPALAGPIAVNQWHEFSFLDVGDLARGCDPDDPLGNFCIPSSGTPTDFLNAPPWTFTAAAAATLTVTDAFESGDRFQLFDFGISIGLTSLPAAGVVVDCGDDPVPCLLNGAISHAVFALGTGNHSITLRPTLSNGGGSGYLMVQAEAAPTAVPEPASVLLFGTGCTLLSRYVRRRRGSPLT